MHDGRPHRGQSQRQQPAGSARIFSRDRGVYGSTAGAGGASARNARDSLPMAAISASMAPARLVATARLVSAARAAAWACTSGSLRRSSSRQRWRASLRRWARACSRRLASRASLRRAPADAAAGVPCVAAPPGGAPAPRRGACRTCRAAPRRSRTGSSRYGKAQSSRDKADPDRSPAWGCHAGDRAALVSWLFLADEPLAEADGREERDEPVAVALLEEGLCRGGLI